MNNYYFPNLCNLSTKKPMPPKKYWGLPTLSLYEDMHSKKQSDVESMQTVYVR